MAPLTRTATTTSTRTNVAARRLSTQIETQFKLTARKEDTRQNARAGSVTMFKLKIGDWHGVAKAKSLHVPQ